MKIRIGSGDFRRWNLNCYFCTNKQIRQKLKNNIFTMIGKHKNIVLLGTKLCLSKQNVPHAGGTTKRGIRHPVSMSIGVNTFNMSALVKVNL